MSPPRASVRALGSEAGYSLVELLVAMSIGLIVTFGAFLLLDVTSSGVSRITSRVHANQTGRVALERIMLELHSVCVTSGATPIEVGSTGTALKFVSENGSSPAFANVNLHEIFYTPATTSTEGTLVEKTWRSSGTAPAYTFATSGAPTTERTLLTGVEQTNETGPVPIFQYFRYYEEGDSGAVLGELNPTPIEPPISTSAVANKIVKVAVHFTATPGRNLSHTFNQDRPVALEDSAIFSLTPSSEAAGNPNTPC
jgi:prepilin-type N-terminal cleavage/methylation domain-containing protein